MKIQYQDELVEAAIQVCLRDRRTGVPALSVTRFHFERERLYRIRDADEREEAFFRLHATWFREWGLEQTLLNRLEEYPLLADALDAVVFRKAHNRKDEGGELYVRTGAVRQGVVAFLAERFAEPSALVCFLRHELMHLHDMVNPLFGYAPCLPATGDTVVQQRLARDRYRVLWDITIDGRLTRRGHAIGTPREAHWSFFSRTYSFWTEERRQSVFAELWAENTPGHETLTALAGDPRGLAHTPEPAPGSACPLCGLPTFDWADATVLEATIVEAVQGEYPRWVPPHGLCRRCLEAYEVIERQNKKGGVAAVLSM